MVIFYRFLLTFTRPGNCWLLMVFFHTKGRHLGSQCLFALGIQHGHVFLPGQGPGAPVWWRNWLRLGGIPTLEVLKVSLKIIKIDLLKRHQKYCIVFVVLFLSLFCFCLCSMRHLSGGLTDNRMSWSHEKTLGGQSHTWSHSGSC